VRISGWLLVPAFALVLFAAHLFHGGATLLAAFPVVLAGVLAVRRWWVARLLQVVLAVATIEWLRTTVVLSQARIAHGQPYVRLVVILAAVAAFTALAAAVFQVQRLRNWYGLSERVASPTPITQD
jgi:hypothetical protein